MSHRRLSRAESREQTRLRLLAAAATNIAKKGLAATSVEDITAKAGFTRGAFYSNFSSKGELFIELLRVDHQHTQENLRTLLNAAASSANYQRQFVSLSYEAERHVESDRRFDKSWMRGVSSRAVQLKTAMIYMSMCRLR